MIKNVIYVEDGSVDVDELEESLGEDTKVIVYRQGAVRPQIEHLVEPISTADDDAQLTAVKRIESTGRIFAELSKMHMTQEVSNKIDELKASLFKS